ncbi:MAG: plastocyanin/azurin family copper-binding protein [Actinomycetota bacterium]
MFTKIRNPLIITVVAMLGLSACGGSTSSPDGGDGEIRTINIQAMDTLRFDPDAVTVAKGEQIRFVVTNAGETEHEFILGDQDVHAHGEGMDMDMDMGGDPQMGVLASLSLPPGETREATVTFDEAGTVEYGCHVDGHYEAGMKGTVTVS